MTFNPALPADHSVLSSAEMRAQLTALKALIDAVPDFARALFSEGLLFSLDNTDPDAPFWQTNQPVHAAGFTGDGSALTGLSIPQVAGAAPVADGTYTMGLGPATNGTITAVTEAS